jgi:hypothetical protein
MNFTQIYTTRKLEKTIAKSIVEKNETENKILGEWVATIFYVDRKKCWLIVNKLTKYLVILSDIKKPELNKITQVFTKNTSFTTQK